MISPRRGFLGAAISFLTLGAVRPSQAQVIKATVTPLKPIVRPKLRIWRLGSLEEKILPTQKAIDTLTSYLQQWDGNSSIDIVWGPDLHVEQIDLATNAVDIIVPVDKDVVVKSDVAELGIRIIHREELAKDDSSCV